MGQPDGGWYDETAPQVVGSLPKDGATNVSAKKIRIDFSEYIKVENASEKVVVSPPQIEAPEITSTGKFIKVALLDSLKTNTTYTIDFSDAISDNNEGNPLGNYTYTFSTGDHIDTMQVAGYVLEAENLEPIKGILVGLYNNLADSAFQTLPMLRVARSDSRGRFVIKGVAPGSYRCFALQDMDGNYMFSQKSEKLAFSHDIIVPSFKPDVRQDTLWTDSLHINSIRRVNYTHFLPDDICLRAFTEVLTDRFLVKKERQDADHFTFFFSYGDKSLPAIRGLNFDSEDAFIVEPNERQDTITYWLKDTALVNQDTLRMEVTYNMTDTLGNLVQQTDTMELLAKTPYAKRLKDAQKEYAKWQKEQKKRREHGDPYDSIMAPKPIDMTLKVNSKMAPDENIQISFGAPLANVADSAIHLYAKHDSLWYRARTKLVKLHSREYQLRAEWKPDIEYSLEIDSAAFVDIYGKASKPMKQGFKVNSLDAYSSLMVTLQGMADSAVIANLLDKSGKVVKSVKTKTGQAEFYYVKPGGYYLNMIVDRNDNGIWDTGDYAANLQPEPVYYYPEIIECREKWDVSRTWNPTATPLFRQKPGAITKQKPEKDKTIKKRNEERAKKLGIQYK